MATLLVMQADFTCHRVDASVLDAVKSIRATPGGPTIQFAVGDAAPPRVTNLGGDVKQIQAALNNFSPLDGGPLVPLTIDGGCGPATRAAIRRFQIKLDLNKVDGIVDVDGQTIAFLRAGPPPPISPDDQVTSHKDRILEVLVAARSTILLASLARVLPGDLLLESLAIVDKYFHVSDAADPGNRLNAIDQVFSDMQDVASALPDATVVIDEPPAKLVKAFMLVVETGGAPSIMMLCPRSRTLNQDGFTCIFVHELAHYTRDFNHADAIRDVAYFHKQPALFLNLAPNEAFHNADSYSVFAMEAAGRPNYNAAILGSI